MIIIIALVREKQREREREDISFYWVVENFINTGCIFFFFFSELPKKYGRVCQKMSGKHTLRKETGKEGEKS